MSHRATKAVWAGSQHRGTVREILYYLAERANRQEVCWPKQATIADELGRSRATVQRSLRVLRGIHVAGMPAPRYAEIELVTVGSGRAGSRYRILVAVLEEAAARPRLAVEQTLDLGLSGVTHDASEASPVTLQRRHQRRPRGVTSDAPSVEPVIEPVTEPKPPDPLSRKGEPGFAFSTDDLTSSWAAICDHLAGELEEFTMHMWIRPLEPAALDERTLTLVAPNHVRTWVAERHLGELVAAARSVLGHQVGVELIAPQPVIDEARTRQGGGRRRRRPRFGFEAAAAERRP